MPGLFELMKWLAEVVHTGDVNNQWYYEIVGYWDTAQEFLAVVGYQLTEIFG